MYRAFLIVLFYIPFVNAQENYPINGIKNNYNPIYAFTNAHIIISPEKEILQGTLLIQNGKILKVDSIVEIPKGSIVKDLDGNYIYPSFIELYSNYGVEKLPSVTYSRKPQYKTNKKGPYHWNQSIRSEFKACDYFKNDFAIAKKYQEIGFGSVLVHRKDGIFRGSGALVLLSDEKENNNIIIDEAASFYSFKKGGSRQTYPTSLMGAIALIRQTILDAEWYKKKKSNALDLTLNSYNQQKSLPQIFESKDALDYSRIYKIGDEFEIDFIIKGNGKEYSRIDEIKNTGYPIILPINFPKNYDVSDAETIDWISLKELKHWETAPYNPIILQKNNITFCLSSSGLENKTAFLKNLRITIKNGLSKKVALKALTINPAKLSNCEHLLGSLEEGKIANFIITSGDIFEDGIIYENWVNGERNVISKKQIDVSGYYTFNSYHFINSSVKIVDNLGDITATIADIDSLPIKIQLNDKELVLASPNGGYRLIGTYNNGSITGSYQDISGKYFHFEMNKDSLIKKDKKRVNNNNDYIIPSIWKPNQSFGSKEDRMAKSVIFRNTTVWTNEKIGILENTDVLIQGGKIIEIGDKLDLSTLLENEKVEEIDATGKHLTCGIIDEHSHIAISRGVNEASESVTAEVSIGDVINPEDINIYRQIAGGVTVAQLLHGSANPIGGQSAIIKLRWGSSAEKMKIEGADGFIKFALGENVKQSNWGDENTIRFPQTRMGVEQVFYDAFYRAKDYEEKWKKYNSLSLRKKRNVVPPREDLELNALVEVLNSKRFITCHSYVQSEINMLMHVADSMGFTVNTFTHILEGYKVADKMKKHGAGASTFSDWWAYKFEVNDAIPHNAALLHNSGVLTAINSDDAEMGRRLNQEAAKAIKYGGVSQEEAWKMITLYPAKLLHLDHRLGSVSVGKDADIVLWSDNPLSVYAKVEKTYIDGILYFDQNKNRELIARDKKEKMRIVTKLQQMPSSESVKKISKKNKLYHCDTIEHYE